MRNLSGCLACAAIGLVGATGVRAADNLPARPRPEYDAPVPAEVSAAFAQLKEACPNWQALSAQHAPVPTADPRVALITELVEADICRMVQKPSQVAESAFFIGEFAGAVICGIFVVTLSVVGQIIGKLTAFVRRRRFFRNAASW